MRTRNGLEIDHKHKVTDYGGNNGYAFWREDSYFPTIWFVRGDNFSDAYENFLTVLPEEEMSYPNLDHEQVAQWENEEMPEGYDWNANGQVVYTETVNGCLLWGEDNG